MPSKDEKKEGSKLGRGPNKENRSSQLISMFLYKEFVNMWFAWRNVGANGLVKTSTIPWYVSLICFTGDIISYRRKRKLSARKIDERGRYILLNKDMKISTSLNLMETIFSLNLTNEFLHRGIATILVGGR